MTFAGSPDRAEARLVPEAGYELDTFRVSGLPRRPGSRRPVPRCARSPRRRACGRILARRRPDVVLGGGGYVAGADGGRRGASPDPGRADRGRRAPRARQPARGAVRQARLPLVSDRRAASRRSTWSPAGRSPATRGRVPRDEARAQLGLPGRGAGAARLRRAGRRARAERAGGRDASASAGRPCCTSPASATTTSCARASRAPDYVLLPLLDELGAAYGAARSRAVAQRLDRLGARRRRPARGARPVPVRDRRPPDEERALLRARGRRDRRPGERARPRARARALAARRSRAGSRAMARRCGSVARPDAADADRGGADRACGRSRVGASGSSGSAARG